jgi:bacteriorhodopsin
MATPAPLTTHGLGGTLPYLGGSVDGGAEHGFGTFGGALGTPLMIGALCMMFTTVFFYVKSFTAQKDDKKYFYVSMSVTGIATLAYLCMRANIGVSYVECSGGKCMDSNALQSSGGKLYPVFWMRYIDWFFTTPFFLLDLCLLAKADIWDTFFVMLMNALCILCGALGALKPSVNIPMFVLGMLTFAAFIHQLFVLDGDDHYKNTMKMTMGIWCAYPIMFLLCEMTHVTTTEVEVWLYCVLDVAAKCGCGVFLVSKHMNGGKGDGSYGAI